MEFKQLESFVAIVKYESFTSAAEQLYISQPTISSHIRQLEDELNYRLIIRTSKKIEVTPRGREFYTFARNVLHERDTLLRRWNNEQNGNMIHIGITTNASTQILPELLPSFRNKYPDLNLFIHQNDNDTILRQLLSSELEVAFVEEKINNDRIEYTPLFNDSLVLITPYADKYQSLENKDKALNTLLSSEPFIMKDQSQNLQECLSFCLKKINIRESDLHIIARLNDQETIKHLVAGGLGIAIMSEKSVQDYIKDKKILSFPLTTELIGHTQYLAYAKNFIIKKNTKSFIKYAKNFFI